MEIKLQIGSAASVLVTNFQIPQQLCCHWSMTNHGCSAIMQVFPAPPQMRFATPPTMWCPPPIQPTFSVFCPYPMAEGWCHLSKFQQWLALLISVDNLACTNSWLCHNRYGPVSSESNPVCSSQLNYLRSSPPTYIPSQVFIQPPFNSNGRLIVFSWNENIVYYIDRLTICSFFIVVWTWILLYKCWYQLCYKM